MKIVAFGTLKGGVGKTMLCFNISGILSQTKKKVLVIDNDLQGNLTNNMGVDRTKSGLHTTYDIYQIEKPQPIPEDLVISGPVEGLKNLDVIPGSIFLHKAELHISSVVGREQILLNYITEYEKFFSQYDYILIDTNPSMSIINQNAFLASDVILLVSDVSMNSMEGAQLFIALWSDACKRLRRKNNIHGFIINDFDTRTKLSCDYLEFLRTSPDTADLREIMLDTVIPRNIRITESEVAGIPLSLYDSHSKGYDAIYTLTKELIQKKIL